MKGVEKMKEMQMVNAGLTATQIRYMLMYMEGSTQKDIARKYKVVQSSVSHTIAAAKRKLQAAGLEAERSYDHDYSNI